MRLRSIIIAAATLLGTSLNAQTTVYSTFGPGDAYNSSYGVSVGESTTFSYWLASKFQYSGADGQRLSRVRVAAFKSSGGDLLVDFLSGPSIQTAALLESWSLSASPGAFSIFSMTSLGGINLSSGQTYWLRLRTGSNTLWGWAPNSQGVVGMPASVDRGASWLFGNNTEPAGAFDVATQSSVVPEPSTYVLMASGLFSLLVVMVRRRAS